MKRLLAILLLVFVFALGGYGVGARQTALQVCVDAPAAQRTRIINSFTGAYNYPVTVKDATGADIPNPETRPAFFKRKLAEHVRQVVAGYEASAAGEAARAAAVVKVESETGIQ